MTPTPTMERDSLVARLTRLRDAKLYKCDSCPEEICCHPSDDIFVCDDGVFCSECLHEGGRSDDGTPAATLEALCLTTAAPLQADASAPASPAIGVQAATGLSEETQCQLDAIDEAIRAGAMAGNMIVGSALHPAPEDELAWWKSKGIDPLFVSLALWRASGDDEVCEQIIRSNRP